MRSSIRWCAAAAAVAAVAGLASLPAATAASPPPIKHVVVIYLENQTFDSILGFWCDIHRARCPDGGMPASVKLANGAVVTPTDDPDTIPNVNHNGPAQVIAMNNGKMNGWAGIPPNGKQTGCSAKWNYACISGYKPAQEPNLAALADKFAISDMTFSMSDSPSWEGHIYAVAASTDGFWGATPKPPKGTVDHHQGWGCDSDKLVTWFSPAGKKLVEPSCVPDWSLGLPNGGAFQHTAVHYVPTIMDRLDAAGLSWKIYGATKGKGAYGMWDICPSFAECLYTKQDQNLVPDDDFAPDAAAGTLPNFSVVTPGADTFYNSCHNAMSITACDNWIGQLLSEIQHSPDWDSTAVFITFDDFGGFYDQVWPGKNSNPDGTQQGPRVPLLIVSPYAKPGYTDTTHTTFSGILAYAESVFGLPPLGVNDAQAYDFSNAFNYSQAPLSPVHMVRRALPWSARHLHLTPAEENDPS